MIDVKLSDGDQTACLNALGEVCVGATTFPLKERLIQEGRVFRVHASIMLTTATSNLTVFRLDNQGVGPLFFADAQIATSASTGGAGHNLIDLVFTPFFSITAGGAPPPVFNANRQHGRTLRALTAKGNGSTDTVLAVSFGLSVIVNGALPQTFNTSDLWSFLIQPGEGIGARVTPPPGNTSQTIAIGFTVIDMEGLA